MEHAFGDLSAIKLYQSQAVGDAGAEAVAQGNEIAFAPGMANFSTRSGQERLGHELSHVMSQRSGQVRGRGFLVNSALEAQADREGAMAAAGEQVYTGPVTHALSDASPSPAVAGPMQAKRRDEDAQNVKDMQESGKEFNNVYATSDYAGFNNLSEDEWETKTHTPNFFSKMVLGKEDQTYKVRKNKNYGLTTDESKISRERDLTWNMYADPTVPKFRKGMEKLQKQLIKKYTNKNQYNPTAYFQNVYRPASPDGKEGELTISGMNINRMFPELASERGRGFNMSKEEMTEFFDGLMAPHKKNMSDQEKLEANEKFDQSMLKYKEILYGDMKHLEKTYGTMIGQMHPVDVAPQMGSGDEYRHHFRFTQDSAQLMKSAPQYFDFENNKDDQHYKDLDQYYGGALNYHFNYQNMTNNPEYQENVTFSDEEIQESMETMPDIQKMEEVEGKINGPRMNPKEYEKYLEDVRERAKTKDYMKGRLFGKFKG